MQTSSLTHKDITTGDNWSEAVFRESEEQSYLDYVVNELLNEHYR